jgi:hypothetical protein
MSEVKTDFAAFEDFLKRERVPGPAVSADFSENMLSNALSVMRSVELYWADHTELSREDYPDEFTDEQWEQIRKEKVAHAGFVNKAWSRLLAGDYEVISLMDEIERADPQNPEKWSEQDRLALIDDPMDTVDRHGWKSDEFIAKVIPHLQRHNY